MMRPRGLGTDLSQLRHILVLGVYPSCAEGRGTRTTQDKRRCSPRILLRCHARTHIV